MEEKEIRKILIKLISTDVEIRETIAKIMTGNTEKEVMKKDKKHTEIETIYNPNKEEQETSKIEELESLLNDIQKKNEKYEEDLSIIKNENETLKEKLNDYIVKFANMKGIYDIYCTLNQNVYSHLQRVLNTSDQRATRIEEFYGYGVQETNVIALWEVIATNIKEYEKDNQLKSMVMIFNYFFDKYSEITYKQINKVIPNIGESYDERIHTRTYDSSAIGIIEEVILPGFSIGKNITKKSLVRVK